MIGQSIIQKPWMKMNMDRMIILLLKLDNIIRNRNTTIFSRDFNVKYS